MMTAETAPKALSVNLDAIPADMCAERRWCVWRYEQVPDKKTGALKYTKVPYQAANPQRNASTTKARTWGTFAQARAALQDGQCDGIGFMLGDGWAGVDFDHFRDPKTGEIDSFVLGELAQLDTYAEVSPSGTGVHALLWGTMPDGEAGRKCGNVEAYSKGRFLTVTGVHVPGTPDVPNARQEQLEACCLRNMPPRVKPTAGDDAQAERAPLDITDAALIDMARKAHDGGKFARLWDGDTSGYPSASEAVAALLCKLAFWTAKDTARMKALYEQSGLYQQTREKWHSRRGESTWGDNEIAKAVQVVTKTYTPTPRTNAQEQAQCADDSESEQSDQQERQRPQIITSARQLREITAEAIKALEAANEPPVVFRRSGMLTRVRVDEDERPIIDTLDEKMVRCCLTEVADFVRISEKDKNGQIKSVSVAVSPPDALVKNILAQSDWTFPGLVGITESPVLRSDGTILTEPGYDSATRLFYTPASGLRVPQIPAQPSRKDALHSLQFIHDELLHDFPFDSKASLAHALALLITPVVRPAIPGKVPMALVTAPASGTGKGLFAELPPNIASGRPASSMSPPTTEEEWGKKITSTLADGPSIILIDNIRGVLKSAALEQTLTTLSRTDRLMGLSRNVTLSQRAVWIATGNNLQLGGDLPRRCYRIRLDAKMSNPSQRQQGEFKHPDITKWAREHRGEILAHLLTIARAWYADGCPAYDVPAMGSFEDWARIVGSILAHAGVSGFLSDLDDMYAEADTERPQWAAFFTAWHDTYKAESVTSHQIAQDATKTDHALQQALPDVLAPSIQSVGALTKALGYQLRDQVNVRYDIGDGCEVYLEQGRRDRNKIMLWRVQKVGTHARSAGDHPHHHPHHHPQPSAQDSSGLWQGARVIAGDTLLQRREKEENENNGVESGVPETTGAQGYDTPQSPAGMPESRNTTDVRPAGDRIASPAGELLCPSCGGSKSYDYASELRCHVCDVPMQVQGGAA